MVTRRYRILERLGEGGCGRVYRCEMGGAGGFTKVVALKLLTTSPDSDAEGLLKRLRDEARILGLLHHRAVVKADSLVLTNSGWATVMEYVEGVDLTSIEQTRMPIRPILEIVEEVASALDAAWSQPRPDGLPLNLIHRDIKPPNIRITLRGEVKLLDFGIARADLESRESHTESIMLGTLKFMAPERLDGIEGPLGDVYSLGLVTARLILGRSLPMPPRRAESHLAMLKELRNDLAMRLAMDAPAMAADITRLVLRMLDYDPNVRPSAKAVAERCRAFLGEVPGPWLREWAPIALPSLLEETRDDTTFDTLVGASLSELTTEVRPRLHPREHIPITRLDVLSSQNVLAKAEPSQHEAEPQAERAVGALIATITLVSLATLAATAWSLLGQGIPVVAHAGGLPEVASFLPAPLLHPTGFVSVEGSDYGLELVSSTGRYRPGRIPAGAYRLEARFEDGQTTAGMITVTAGEAIVLRCEQDLRKCARTLPEARPEK